MPFARRRLWYAVVASAAVVLAYLVVTWARSGDGASLDDLALQELDGRPVRGRDLLGAPALVNVWATWCAPCRAEQPTLLALAREHGVPVIGLVYRDTADRAARWLSFYGDPYVRVALDPSGQALADVARDGVPLNLLVDRLGRVHWRHVGALSLETAEQEVLPRLRRLAQSVPSTDSP